MKDLSIYFETCEESKGYAPGQIGERILNDSNVNYEQLAEGSIALIYVPDYRNSDISQNENWINDFRQSLFELYAGEWKAEICELGIIRPGESVADTYVAVRDVVTELVKAEVFPVVIGGSQDLTYPIYQAYEKLEQTINIIAVDPALDLGDPDREINAKGWLNKIVLHKPNYLFNFSLFGYQSYLVNPKETQLLNDLYFDAYRLGDFYNNEKMVEPQLRNADILSFDMDAIRSSDNKSNQCNLPNGFYGEDACRIMRYAGLSDKLTSLGLFNFSPGGTGYHSDLNLLSQMIWYFIEGFSLRKKDYPIGSKTAYIKYRVNIDDFRDEIIFYKSNKSSRWWMEVPYPKIKGVKLQRHLLVPCDYEDYENALNNDLPDLWLRTYKKLS
jgi:arginase family enzyme